MFAEFRNSENKFQQTSIFIVVFIFLADNELIREIHTSTPVTVYIVGGLYVDPFPE